MLRCLPPLILFLFLAPLISPADEPKFKLTDQEKKLLELTNAERMKEDLPPLKINVTLMKLARDHSKNMAKQGKLEHELDDKTPRDRLVKSGYPFRTFGENIAYEEGAMDLAAVMKGWMDSPGHKKNILGKDFTEIGISLASNGKGETYYTQVFARARK